MQQLRSPWIDDELALLDEHVERFIKQELLPHAESWESNRRVDRETWRKLGEAGLLLPSVPEEYGGSGGTRGHDVIIQSAIARAGLGGGIGAGVGVHSTIVSHYILAYGTDVQKRRWLPGMAAGELIGAVAMTEPGAGSDLQAVRTTAVKDGDHYVINGSKTFITNGQNADLVVVVAKTDPKARGKGISLIVVETGNAPGFERGRNLEKIGMHAQDTSELFFQDLRVPAENLLGETEGAGFGQLMNQLAWERLSCALGAVVSMERAVEMTIEYVRGREMFGSTLFDIQNTQFKLADCKTQAVIARTFVDELMVRLLAGDLDETTAAMAKLWTTDALGNVSDTCLQLHGGYGYMKEYPISKLWVEARPTRIFAGSNEIMKLIIARSL
jgi:acyl-CoA dehydrogenase